MKKPFRRFDAPRNSIKLGVRGKYFNTVTKSLTVWTYLVMALGWASSMLVGEPWVGVLSTTAEVVDAVGKRIFELLVWESCEEVTSVRTQCSARKM